MSLLVEQAPPLRPYQVAALEQIERAYADGKRAPILALATGAGKASLKGAVHD